MYGVDHGVSFHVEDKLRTVLWQWAGRAADRTMPSVLCARSAPTLDGPLGRPALSQLLTVREVRRTIAPCRPAARRGRAPVAVRATGRPIPWPPM